MRVNACVSNCVGMFRVGLQYICAYFPKDSGLQLVYSSEKGAREIHALLYIYGTPCVHPARSMLQLACVHGWWMHGHWPRKNCLRSVAAVYGCNPNKWYRMLLDRAHECVTTCPFRDQPGLPFLLPTTRTNPRSRRPHETLSWVQQFSSRAGWISVTVGGNMRYYAHLWPMYTYIWTRMFSVHPPQKILERGTGLLRPIHTCKGTPDTWLPQLAPMYA